MIGWTLFGSRSQRAAWRKGWTMATSVGHSVVVRRVAMAVATVDLLAVVCLILFFVVGGPFGSINDVANAAVGVLSAVLAYPIWCFRLARTQRLGDDVRL
jgi:hypothetical protein